MVKVSIEPPKERIVTIQMTEGEAEVVAHEINGTRGIGNSLYECLCNTLNQKEENL